MKNNIKNNINNKKMLREKDDGVREGGVKRQVFCIVLRAH